jgi:hypothetical protein
VRTPQIKAKKEGPKAIVGSNSIIMDAPKADPEEPSNGEEDTKPAIDSNAEAARKAKDAAKARSDELRNVLQAKGEQGNSMPGYVPEP